MAKYRVLVYGRNFLLTFEERGRTMVKRTGFYTTRFVTAGNARQAEYRAMDVIRGDNRLRASLKNSRTDPPIMHALEIQRLPADAPFSKAGTGYTFFHGRGAGRPRKLTLAPDARIPQDIRRAVRSRYRS